MASASSSLQSLSIEVDDRDKPENPYGDPQNHEGGEEGAEEDHDDDDDDEHQSYAGEQFVAPSTASAKSSIFRHQEENGRTYHAYKAGKYVLPNDELENNRLDLQNHLAYITFGRKLYLAPLQQPKRVLDIGTGTGIWAINYADENPDVEVIGMDLSPTQPTFVPLNLMFEIDDLEESWTFSSKFDFIRCGMMCGSFHNWQKFYQQSYSNLNTDGFLEVQDICFILGCDDNSIPSDSSVLKWSLLLTEAAAKMGIPLNACSHAKEDMRAAGFVDVVEKTFKWPLNQWPKQSRYKELGMWCLENFLMGLEGMSLALLTRGLGWSLQEVHVLCAHVRNELMDTRIHAYWPIYVVYGRKPAG